MTGDNLFLVLINFADVLLFIDEGQSDTFARLIVSFTIEESNISKELIKLFQSKLRFPRVTDFYDGNIPNR